MAATVDAYPLKQFFIEMFTRDIALEDCILDLVDNSMDALLRIRQIDIENEILAFGTGGPVARRPRAHIRLDYSDKHFQIVDNCGGIRYEDAAHEVFCFGHHADAPKGRLGVYGIGLKRAIFKIGNRIEVESHTEDGGFKVEINVNEWAAQDRDLRDWTFPVKKVDGNVGRKPAGTTITITELHREVKSRLNDGTLDSALRKTVAQTYPFFLGHLVDLKINRIPVEKRELPFGGSDEIEAGLSKFEEEGVKVSLLASIAPKDKRTQELAGWYVLCNGRVVVTADKSDLTGWGAGLPAFHSKYRAFVGLALFTSENPALLPWTTSKRGLNREALVFQLARNRMTSAAKPVITFLNDMYPSEMPEHPPERAIAERVVQQDFRSVLQKAPTQFRQVAGTTVRKKTARVQYDAKLTDLERIRKRLRRPGLSASEIGRITFDHYLKTECPE